MEDLADIDLNNSYSVNARRIQPLPIVDFISILSVGMKTALRDFFSQCFVDCLNDLSMPKSSINAYYESLTI